MLALAAGALAPFHLKDALGVVAVAALVGTVLQRPVVGAYVLVGLVPVTSGLATGLPVPHVRLSEALIGAIGVALLVSVRRRDAVAWRRLDWVLVAYALAWAAFGFLAHRSLHQHLSLGDWGTLIGQFQFFLVYRGVRLAVRTTEERRTALGVLLLASAPVALLAILQKLNAPGVRSLILRIVGGATAGTAAVATGHSFRATGPFNNWAALAGFLLPILLVLIALALGRMETQWRRWFVAAGVLGVVALALTEEQSAIVCLAVGAAVLAKRYGKGQIVLRWAPVVAVAVAVLAGPSIVHRISEELAASAGTGRVSWVPQTLSFRWSVWTHQYFPAIAQRPLTGYGVVLPPVIRWPYPESQYVSFLMEGGFSLLVLFAGMVWAMLRGAGDAARSVDPLDRALGQAVAIAIVSMLVMSTMWPFLSNGGMPQVLWALLALTVPRKSRADDGTVPSLAGWEPLGRGDGREPMGRPDRSRSELTGVVN